MSENGEIYTTGKKFYTPAGTDGMDKFHLCICLPGLYMIEAGVWKEWKNAENSINNDCN